MDCGCERGRALALVYRSTEDGGLGEVPLGNVLGKKGYFLEEKRRGTRHAKERFLSTTHEKELDGGAKI